MPTSSPDISVLFTRVAELSIARGDAPINRLPGAWHCAFTDAKGHEWRVACNGHREPVESPIQAGSLIQPYEAHVYFNGWPFAIISPTGGGVIGAGEGANEDSCIAALEAEIARLTS